MAKNSNLSQAKSAKNDEFYTQYADIQKEVNAYLEFNPDVFRGKTVLLPCDDPEWSNFTRFFAENFELFGLKKLISTSYAVESKKYKEGYMPTLFETESPLYSPDKTRTHGKIFILENDVNNSGRIDLDDLQWEYLQGDGDFRSKEVTALRDEADIIITNPPFSLFREFVAWIMAANKQFLIIGNQNAITYKEVFPLIKENQLWIGATGNGSDMVFGVPEGAQIADSDRAKAARLGYIGNYTRLGNSCWFTNIDHGRRHQPLQLMTMADNIKYSKHKEIRGVGYQHYDNYDAIEVPYTDAIPSDYDGCLGVPISFMDKYCPEQFEIIGMGEDNGTGYSGGVWQGGSKSCLVNGKAMFKRIFIRPTGGGNYLTINELYKWKKYIIDTYGYSDEEIVVITGVMGVPISFLDKYCPEQFEILGIDRYIEDNPNYGKRFTINSKEVYARVLIRQKK